MSVLVRHAARSWGRLFAARVLAGPQGASLQFRADGPIFESIPPANRKGSIMASSPDLKTGRAVREACRRGQWTGPTASLAPGFAQANLVVLPEDWAWDFLLFCRRNPKPCPVLEVTEPGATGLHRLADAVDLRTDLPRYRIWQNGKLIEEPTEVTRWWRDDLVSFLIGCSFTFDAALVRAGVPVKHVQLGVNVPKPVVPARRSLPWTNGRLHAASPSGRCHSSHSNHLALSRRARRAGASRLSGKNRYR